MKIIFASLNRIPSRGTHTITIMNTCRALAAIPGNNVLLLIARYPKIEAEYGTDPFSFYGIKKNFDVIWLSQSRRTFFPNSIHSLRNQIGMFFSLFRLFREIKEEFCIYSRHHGLVLFTVMIQSLVRNPWYQGFFCELHGLPKIGKRLSKCQGLITISNSLKNDLLAGNINISNKRVHVAHDGVDIEKFSNLPDESMAKRAIGLSTDHLMIGYIGRVNMEKGAKVLIDAFNQLKPEYPLILLMVGKVFDPLLPKQVKKGIMKDVIFTGHVLPKDVTKYLAASDILVLPSTKNLSYWKYTSPLKLFEYMAAGKPIIAAALPGINEIIEHGRNGLLFEPGDEAGLSTKLDELISDADLRQELAKKALSDIPKYSWDARAVSIQKFINKAINEKNDSRLQN